MKIALITGSRSDRGALEMVYAALKDAHAVHWVDLEMEPAQDAGHAVTLACCAADTVGHYDGMRSTDLIILHGDRYEILGAAMAANIMGIPIAHLGGGDITEGSQDDSYRHAITKLSHLHFPTHQAAADRIVQMGEDPARVHVVGDPSVDRAMRTETMGRDETFRAVGLAAPQRCMLVSFHPNPLGDTGAEVTALCGALAQLSEDVAVVWIGPNADAGNDVVRRHARAFCKRHVGRVVYYDNLDARTYFSLMEHCDVMVGNSSAGLIEAPCFGLPVVNIGDRQRGRPGAGYVVWVRIDAAEIAEAVEMALRIGKPSGPLAHHPYGDGHAAERIAKIIGAIEDARALVRKVFHHVG